MKEMSLSSMEHLEQQIFDKMKFLNIVIYHGERPLKDCLQEAVQEFVGMSDAAFCSVFGIHLKDYVNYLYAKVED